MDGFGILKFPSKIKSSCGSYHKILCWPQMVLVAETGLAIPGVLSAKNRRLPSIYSFCVHMQECSGDRWVLFRALIFALTICINTSLGFILFYLSMRRFIQLDKRLLAGPFGTVVTEFELKWPKTPLENCVRHLVWLMSLCANGLNYVLLELLRLVCCADRFSPRGAWFDCGHEWWISCQCVELILPFPFLQPLQTVVFLLCL